KRLLLPPELINQDARTLSGGESSRLALVRTILVEPDVLLLDEPIAALDPRAASAVLRLIAEWPREVGGRGVVLVSHIGELAKLPCLSVLDLEATEVLEPETKKDNPAGKEGDGVE
ncbi:MAG: ABC transporter ATP-binding protein, partial [Firmicutes bacterium]|nr:ABC transporter ATP-binding protein [Bacillota bacterium]